MKIFHITESRQTNRQTSGKPESVTDVVLNRRGNVWQCRTGTWTLFVTPVSRDDCRWSVVALEPYTELDDVPLLINKHTTNHSLRRHTPTGKKDQYW